MGQACTKEQPEAPTTNEPTVAPQEGGMRPATAATPAEHNPHTPLPPSDIPFPHRGTSDVPMPHRAASDISYTGGNMPSPYTSGFGGGDWTTADIAPPLHAKVQEALKRAKPRSWTAFPDLKDFGSYITKKLKNTSTNEFYEGHQQRDIPYGWGTLIGKDGDLMEGVFIDGKPARYIRHIDTNGTIYEGDFLLGRNGKGSLIEADGTVVRSQTWVNGVAQGEIIREDQNGKVIFRGIRGPKGYHGKCFLAQNGFTIEANFVDNIPQGPVTKQYPDGSRYEGTVDALYNEEGQGTLTFSDGRKFQGPFTRGKANGKGTFYTDTGKASEQTWKDGKRV